MWKLEILNINPHIILQTRLTLISIVVVYLAFLQLKHLILKKELKCVINVYPTLIREIVKMLLLSKK